MMGTAKMAGGGSGLGQRAPRALRLGALGVAAASLWGCPDPAGKYDRYVEQTESARNGGGGGTTDVAPVDVVAATGIHVENQEFFFAFAAIIKTDRPFRFRANTTIDIDDAGNGTMSIQLQPVTAFKVDKGALTDPGGEVTDGLPIIDLGEFEVTEGKFHKDVGVVELLGTANPVTGSDVLANLILDGTIVSDRFYCGSIDGQVTKPTNINLAGSSFGAEVLDDATTLPSFPIDYGVSCETGPEAGTTDTAGGDDAAAPDTASADTGSPDTGSPDTGAPADAAP